MISRQLRDARRVGRRQRQRTSDASSTVKAASILVCVRQMSCPLKMLLLLLLVVDMASRRDDHWQKLIDPRVAI